MTSANSLTLSMFNLYCDIDSDTTGIYNTLHDSALLISKDVLSKLPGNIEDGEIRNLLLNEKIAFTSNVDEKLYFQYFINKLKYAPRRASFTVLVTSDCNFTCEYCFEGSNHKIVYMSKQTADDIVSFVRNSIDKHSSLNNVLVAFYGGEPLLNRSIIHKICNGLTESNNYSDKTVFTITTNLSLLTNEDIKMFEKYRFVNVQVAIDGPQHIHNRRRRSKDDSDTYTTIIRNIQRLVDHQISTIVILNYDQQNYSYMDELIAEIKLRLPFDKLIFFLNPIVESLSNHNCRRLFMSTELETDLFIELYDKLRGNRIPVDAFGQRDMVCMATSDVSCTVDLEGNLYKCGFTVGNSEYQVGTIYDDLYSNLNYELILDEPWKVCLENACPYLPICGAGCRGLALVKNLFLSDPVCEKKDYYEKVFNRLLKDHFQDLIKKGCENKRG